MKCKFWTNGENTFFLQIVTANSNFLKEFECFVVEYVQIGLVSIHNGFSYCWLIYLFKR
jgi:hypothetical protein